MENGKVKPIALAMHETKQDIANVINNCGLPPCIVQSIVGDIYREVSVLAEKEVHDAMHESGMAHEHDSGGEQIG